MRQPALPVIPKSYSNSVVHVDIPGIANTKPDADLIEDEDLLSEDDFEASAYINTQEEANLKATLWEKINAEYLAEQELRKAFEESKKTPKPRRRNRQGAHSSLTAAEAAVEMLRKRVSTKINYDALNTLFDTSNDIYNPQSNLATSPTVTPIKSITRTATEAEGEDEEDESPPCSPLSSFVLTCLS